MVSTWAGFANVTAPGPLTLLQVVWTGPSSVTVPSSVAAAGRVTVRSGPAPTCGVCCTVMTTSSKALRALSLAVSRSV